jgi:hypothetical protein
MFETLLLEQDQPADVIHETGNYTYMGWFKPGDSDYNTANCFIVRIESVNGLTTRTYANGARSYTNVWSNHENLVYSHLK